MTEKIAIDLENKVIDTVQVYCNFSHFVGIADINGKPFTKISLIRWSINPARKYVCVFCGNVTNNHVKGCLACHEYKGIMPYLGGGI